jgi:S1-C subfamily serine protease
VRPLAHINLWAQPLAFVKLELSDLRGLPAGSGSGAVIGHLENSSFILTAGHVCDDPLANIHAIDVDANKHSMVLLAISEKSDLCLLVSMKKIPKPALNIAKKMVDLDEKVYNVAAPYGIHKKNTVLKFEGFYAGDWLVEEKGFMVSTYTFPTAPGSSGSPIMNKDKEIIGVLSMGFSAFESLALAVTLEDIHLFLRENANKLIQLR